MSITHALINSCYAPIHKMIPGKPSLYLQTYNCLKLHISAATGAVAVNAFIVDTRAKPSLNSCVRKEYDVVIFCRAFKSFEQAP